MAYVSNEDLLDEEAGGPGTGGGAPSALTGGGSQAPSGTRSQQKTPGRFANLNEYLRVNSPQQFGNQVAGKLGEDIQKGNESLEQAGNEFKQRADANTVKDTQGLTARVASTPSDINVDDYAKLRDAEYKGPINFSDSQDLYGKVNSDATGAVNKTNASKTEGGRFALLDNYYGKPTYSRGQKTLDNLLIQNDPNSKQAFAQMQQNAQALQQNVKDKGVELGGYGTQAKAATEATRAGARGALGIDDTGNLTGTGAIGSTQQAAKDRLAEYGTSIDDVMKKVSEGKVSELSPEIAQFIASQGGTFGANANSFLNTVDKNALTEGSVRSPEEQAKLRALSQLAGVDDLSAYEGESYYGKPLFDYNEEGLKGAIAQGKQSYDNEINSIWQQPAPGQYGDMGFTLEQYNAATGGAGKKIYDEKKAAIDQKYGVQKVDPINDTDWLGNKMPSGIAGR